MEAPRFQRPYVWELEKNWAPLWEAVQEVANKNLTGGSTRTRFLGAVVVKETIGRGLTSVKVWELIDGQQRVTSLQLLLAAVRDILKEAALTCQQAGSNQASQDIEQLRLMIEQLCRNGVTSGGQPQEQFKVWPTDVDRDNFGKVMLAGGPDKVQIQFGAHLSWSEGKGAATRTYQLGCSNRPKVQEYLDSYFLLGPDDLKSRLALLDDKADKQEAKSHATNWASVQGVRLARAYLYFHRTASLWLGDPLDAKYTQRAMSLRSALANGLDVVAIELRPTDDEQQIFETLNSLGEPLLPTDLVKNYLFRRADREGYDPPTLYDTYWKAFDAGVPATGATPAQDSWWRAKVTQGRQFRYKIDLFLQHYLSLVTLHEVPTSDLFDAYKQWAGENGTGQSQASGSPLQTTADAQAQMKQFREYADIFKSFEGFDPTSQIGLFFARLEALETTTIMPLLLALFRHYKGREHQVEMQEILTDLESFLVRRAICHLSPKNYNRFFLQVARRLTQSNDFSPQKLRGILLAEKVETSVWPDDQRVRKAWTTLPVYETMKPPRRMIMILKALDRQLQSPLNVVTASTKDVNIEHLLPQKWPRHWPLPASTPQDDIDRRNLLLHTFGNLTLVGPGHNTTLSNRPWHGFTDAKGKVVEGKRALILKHNTLNLNHSSQLPNDWDEAAIEKRGRDLFDQVIQIWPYPATATPTAAASTPTSAGAAPTATASAPASKPTP